MICLGRNDNTMILAFVLVIFCAAVAAEQNQTESDCNPKACLRNAKSERSVCGSDGLSYPNKCHLERARCLNRNITLVKRGPCKSQKLCTDWQKYEQDSTLQKNGFRPKCRKDGQYEQIQCHTETGYCWCVTEDGVPIPNTAVRIGRKVRCGRRNNKNRRRSPLKRNKNKMCKKADKAQLNSNLINSFHSEFLRDNMRNESDANVVNWKFKMLDTDGNHVLNKNEYRDIRRLVKKAMKPKKCAKLFPKSCDINGDHEISLQEWLDCLHKDGIDVKQNIYSAPPVASRVHQFFSVKSSLKLTPGASSSPSRRRNSKNGKSGLTSMDSEDTDEDYFDAGPLPGVPSESLSSMSEGSNYYDDVEEDSSSCLNDKKTALEEHNSPDYIPECTPDGRYQKIQCYKSAGYCWCVNEDTGKNIPGTSVKNGVPNCDQHKLTNKSMKGCPDDRKYVFLKELMQFLHNKMTEMVSANSTFTSLSWMEGKEEQAAAWSFVVFDKNKNKMLDKHEWKAFKDMVSQVKGLKKCGKKLPRYCDSNKDRQISMTEWLDCLNVQQGSSSSIAGPSISSSLSVRAGRKNPLSMLKDD